MALLTCSYVYTESLGWVFWDLSFSDLWRSGSSQAMSHPCRGVQGSQGSFQLELGLQRARAPQICSPGVGCTC